MYRWTRLDNKFRRDFWKKLHFIPAPPKILPTKFRHFCQLSGIKLVRAFYGPELRGLGFGVSLYFNYWELSKANFTESKKKKGKNKVEETAEGEENGGV